MKCMFNISIILDDLQVLVQMAKTSSTKLCDIDQKIAYTCKIKRVTMLLATFMLTVVAVAVPVFVAILLDKDITTKF